MRRLLLMIATLLCAALGLVPAGAQAEEVPNADIAIVSVTPSVRFAKVGEVVTFTVVATNNGPDPAEVDTYVGNQLTGLAPVLYTCDRGISPDTPACEYGALDAGQSVTTTLSAEVAATGAKFATMTACVQPWNVDSDPSNDCATASIRIVGRRKPVGRCGGAAPRERE
jgi:uncharacterized repeat protein (TIGR01451 family)